MKFGRILLFTVFMFLTLVVSAFAYQNLGPVPEDWKGLLQYFMDNVGNLKASGWPLITGFVVVVVLGLFKALTATFPKILEKMGAWAFVVPLVLGALGEIAFNFPKPATIGTILMTLLAGMTGNGLVAIAIYHIQKKVPWLETIIGALAKLQKPAEPAPLPPVETK